MSLIINEKMMEGDDVPKFAPSLLVPNVQELVRNEPLQVPERYIRNQEDMEKSEHNYNAFPEIPTIDLSLLLEGNKGELVKLDMACKDWGFFQVVNHRVPSHILHGMKEATAKFFKLPMDEKNKFSMPSDDIQGYGHAYVVSDEQKLDWTDGLMLVIYPSSYRKLQFWPTTPQGFKGTIEAYSAEVRRVAEELLCCLSLMMGMNKSSILELHKEILQALRVNYYPPCSIPNKVLDISPQSDTSTITILMQDDNVSGLQIRHQGDWVPVKPIQDALIVNVGDVLEIWSNGKYKSIEHKAVLNETMARLSYASFICPQDDVKVEPLDHVIDSDGSVPMYKNVRYGEYLRQSMRRKMEGKAHTDMAKITNGM